MTLVRILSTSLSKKTSTLLAILLTVGINKAISQDFYFCGPTTNDLYIQLSNEGYQIKTYQNIKTAIQEVPKGKHLIIVASEYPGKRLNIENADYILANKKKIRLFLEYPSSIPGYTLPDTTHYDKLERGVVFNNFFGKELPSMSILGINGAHLIDINVNKPLLVMAKIAGFDHAQFGLDSTRYYPLLFQKDNALIATTSLSNFKTGRFGPVDSWKYTWEGILKWITRNEKFRFTNFSADPVPMYAKNEILPANASKIAIAKGTEWLWKARLFIHPSWEQEKMDLYQPKNGDPNLYFGPPITKDLLQGDGSRGIMEGHGSTIYHDGTQDYRYFIRADVQGESAFLLAAAGKTLNQPGYSQTAEKLLDYLFYTSGFRGDARNHKDSSSYGLISWANTHPGTFFNDDNARCILGAIGASSYMKNDRWNKFIIENILGNFRTSSKQGFQGNALNQSEIENKGWQYYYDRDFVNTHPHFESWMWACYLWLYDKTKYQPLLDKAKTGIRLMMEAYPDNWKTQNGIQQERARMVLPLAWLVRIENTPEHVKWLDEVVTKVLEYQETFGAIREELGNSETDTHKILVTSNDAYGKNEASLIAINGDPVADMLYTCNFLFFGLNEAAHATKNPTYFKALENLSDFLIRIQSKSEKHDDLDGAWFRAFDFGRWDYWASNADNGWGAWSTLTGWIQSWIVGTQALLENKNSYWETTQNLNLQKDFEESLWMLKK
ncbi:hypothetical protein [Gynurincola endophyticus]|uniref:hypothetical protein n=1 Tax=Gynurincola endophyticus TaxID=2479004 RepID=UPI000F8E388A|nr:hypothetical protein [Gynurincola endophyticus]